MKSRLHLLCVLALFLPSLSHAWWNGEWAYRKKIILNTSPAGANTASTVTELPVLVRLHTGNFLFADLNDDGSDLRFVAADDKTPLHYHIEQWDRATELALVWVRVPSMAAGSGTEHIWMYFGNKKAAKEDDPKQRYDLGQLLTLHFNDPQGAVADASSYAHAVSGSVKHDAQGPIDGAAVFAGAPLQVPAAPTIKLTGSAGFTYSAWVRIGGPQSTAQLIAVPEAGGGFSVGIQGSKLTASAAGASVQSAADLAPNAWHHIAASVLNGKLTLFIDGVESGSAAATVTEITGAAVIGRGFNGALDEVQLSGVGRSADWVKAAWAAQGPESKLVTIGEDEQASSGGGHSYFSILLSAVTLDGWVVIGILMVMMVISFAVMIGKSLFVSRTDRANQKFLSSFQKDPVGMLDPKFAESAPGELQRSSLFRLYRTGLKELALRLDHLDRAGGARTLSSQSLGAIKASLDASMVRESARLNNQMVLLTIAISGGPFLGLLGTVVGVMITFAAIAAAGDVNVNSIAPGIAAALVATVAGLGVAIPALFGYNYLASRIKDVSNEMTVFADEFVSRLAERYSN